MKNRIRVIIRVKVKCTNSREGIEPKLLYRALVNKISNNQKLSLDL